MQQQKKSAKLQVPQSGGQLMTDDTLPAPDQDRSQVTVSGREVKKQKNKIFN